jgi:hypothetical protein
MPIPALEVIKESTTVKYFILRDELGNRVNDVARNLMIYCMFLLEKLE